MPAVKFQAIMLSIVLMFSMNIAVVSNPTHCCLCSAPRPSLSPSFFNAHSNALHQWSSHRESITQVLPNTRLHVHADACFLCLQLLSQLG